MSQLFFLKLVIIPTWRISVIAININDAATTAPNGNDDDDDNVTGGVYDTPEAQQYWSRRFGDLFANIANIQVRNIFLITGSF